MSGIIKHIVGIFKIPEEDGGYIDEDGYSEYNEGYLKNEDTYEKDTKKVYEKPKDKFDDKVKKVNNTNTNKSFFTKSTVNTPIVVGGNSMNNEPEIVSVRPSDEKKKIEIADKLLAGKTVIINLDLLEIEAAQRVVDFIAGVTYAINGDMKFPSKCIVVAVPNEFQLSGSFESSNYKTSEKSIDNR